MAQPQPEADWPGWQVNALCLASRLVFAAVLLPWFVTGGLTGIAGLSMSVGPAVGRLPLSLGAYYTYLPGLTSDLTAGLPVIPVTAQVYVAFMVLLELALPLMIVAGLWVRVAAPALVLHQLITLVTTQPLSDAGALFDASPFDMVPDQMLFWTMLLAPLALFGAGPLSVDSLVHRRA